MADVRQLDAVVVQGRRSAAGAVGPVRWRADPHGAELPGAARPWRRVHLCGQRSAQPRGRQRHLAAAVRFPDQWSLFLCVRPPVRNDLGRRPARDRRGRHRTTARRRHDRSAQRLRRKAAAPGRPAPPTAVQARRAAGLVELFNVFNHANYGGYSTAQSLGNYSQPTSVSNVAYYPREAQLGIRFTF